VTNALLYHLTPSKGEVLGYVQYCLQSLRPHFTQIVAVVEGPLDENSQKNLIGLCDHVVLNGNWRSKKSGYKAGLEHLGWDNLGSLDELTMMDSDIFGPVFPYSEMHAAMNAREDLDFWSIGEFKTRAKDDEPLLLETSLITIRTRLLHSADFREFWTDGEPGGASGKSTSSDYDNLQDYFSTRGFKCGGYISLSDYDTVSPLSLEIKECLERSRLPFISFAAFCGSPALQDEAPANLNQILPYLNNHSDYPTEHFWQGVLPRASLRTLHTNLAYQFTFDSDTPNAAPKWDSSLKIAVCAHIYYDEAFEEIYERARNIPLDFDFYITTSSPEKKVILDEKCAKAGIAADVRVVGENRGRDMSSLFIDLKDVVLEKDYDLVCRLHSKKSPQVNHSTGNYFKNFIFDSVLSSRDYTSHLLDFLVTHPHVGMAFAPMIHTGYRSMGHAWFSNRKIFGEILDDLGCDVPEEEYSAIAAYGTVFWFRPDALRPFFERTYQYSQYNQEPNHIDGGLAHGQERAMTYVAQSRGYMSATVWPNHMAAQSTTLMEYKMDSVYSTFSARNVAPHRYFMSFLRGDKGRGKVREALRDFEHYMRPSVKKLGAALGIKSKKRSRKL